jgi:hypothetical protein
LRPRRSRSAARSGHRARSRRRARAWGGARTDTWPPRPGARAARETPRRRRHRSPLWYCRAACFSQPIPLTRVCRLRKQSQFVQNCASAPSMRACVNRLGGTQHNLVCGLPLAFHAKQSLLGSAAVLAEHQTTAPLALVPAGNSPATNLPVDPMLREPRRCLPVDVPDFHPALPANSLSSSRLAILKLDCLVSLKLGCFVSLALGCGSSVPRDDGRCRQNHPTSSCLALENE